LDADLQTAFFGLLLDGLEGTKGKADLASAAQVLVYPHGGKAVIVHP
jgi:hypothetical protein